MIPRISDERVFYVTIQDQDNNELEDEVDPVALGLSIFPLASSFYDKVLTFFKGKSELPTGVFSWFDIANTQMRSIEVIACTVIDGTKYIASTKEGFTYTFELLTKRIYETILHPQGYVIGPDTFEDDAAVQKWFLKVHTAT